MQRNRAARVPAVEEGCAAGSGVFFTHSPDVTPEHGNASISQNQDRPKVIHVGAGRAADYQIAQRREKAVAVIVFQQRLGAQPERCGVRDRIGAVQRDRQTEQEFGIAPTAPAGARLPRA